MRPPPLQRLRMPPRRCAIWRQGWVAPLPRQGAHLGWRSVREIPWQQDRRERRQRGLHQGVQSSGA
eukprot:scaffold238563_cov31-Tisochrysis_lutea.AAC.1